MEEQRARQEDEARKVQAQSVTETPGGTSTEATNEETLLEQAINMSMVQEPTEQTPSVPDFASMSEEEQITYAMQMSLQNSGTGQGDPAIARNNRGFQIAFSSSP